MRTRTFRGMVAAAITTLAAVGAVSVSSADSAARVVGGGNAPAGSWPAIVALVSNPLDPSGTQFCGGTLIDPAWVLTAAHCITDVSGAVVPAASLDVVAGLTNLATDTGQASNVTSIVRHPSYVDGAFRNDVALLHLETPVIPGETVATMELVSPLRPELWDAASPAEIAGWGNTLPPSATSFPDALQQAQVPIVSDATCAATNLGSGPPPVFVSAEMVCAGPELGGIDTCQGDSGGPLTVLDGLARVLVGAVSWGVGCALPNLPGVYTRLDAYRGFIFGAGGVSASVPGTPTGVDALAGVQLATVSWTAPPSGGRAVQTYGVRIIRNGIPGSLVLVQGNATQTTITGLTPGDSYTFTVTAANAVGLGAQSSPTGAVIPTVPRPVNTVAPTVGGVARRGSVLTAMVGSWNFLGTTEIAWERCDATGVTCQDIVGATSDSVQLTASDVGSRLRVRVVAANAAGTTTARSELSAAVVPPAPAVISGPTISGIARVGRPLQAGGGSWSEAADVQLAWQSCDASGVSCTDIAGAVGATFTPTRDHVGRRIRVGAAASNAGGVGQVTSQATSPVRPVFAIGVIRAQRVTQTPGGRLTVTIGVRVEPGARLAMKVLDHRGGARRLKRLQSRVNGRVPPGRGSTTLAALVPTSGVMNITIVLAGATVGPRRTARISLTATDPAGERAVIARAFPARL